MKNIILGLVSFLVVHNASAYVIKGTLPAKGSSSRTEIMLNGEKTVCRVKIDKIWNLKEEDAYGNPGYSVRVSMSLDASPKFRMSRDFFVSNMFADGVKDLEFSSKEGAKMTINEKGVAVKATIPYNSALITCSF